jgi:peptidoglycan/xylan/chitin deacetylase (PgdA/CDA1 family)
MPANRQVGMDHDFYQWSPLPTRAPVRWPDDRSLAFSVILNLEFVELEPPADAVQSRWLAGGLGPRPHPNIALLSSREYGHRVGIFRLLDLLDRHGIPASVALDAMTATAYPWLVAHLLNRGVDIIAHGISISRIISSQMSEDQERAYIAETLDVLEGATGTRPVGWMGAEQGESERTPHLLAEAGLSYVCDWSNDEQPYPMDLPAGRLWSVPTMLEYDDAFALFQRRMTLASYSAMFKAGVDQLVEDGRTSARFVLLSLRPWLTGQPFRVGFIDDMIEHVVRGGHVWAATVSDVATYCRDRSSEAEAS